VIASFAGLRPLAVSDESRPSAVSRETRIYESESGMISITGGKFTTYRRIAEDVTNRILRRLKLQTARACLTASRPLWGGEIENLEAYIEIKTEELGRSHRLDRGQVEHLIKTFGTHHESLLRLVKRDPSMGERLHPALPNLKAEIPYCAREEEAVTLSDVLRRRSMVALGPYRTDPGLIGTAINLMSAEMGWSKEEAERQKNDYLREIS